MTYVLRDGVTFCQVGGRLIFLDIVADRYFALSRNGEAALVRLMSGDQLGKPDIDHLDRLMEQGILQMANGPCVPIAPCTPPLPPDQSLLDGHYEQPMPLATIVAVAAVAASLARVRCRSLRSNLTSAVAHRDPLGAKDPATLAPIAAAFDRAGRLVSSHNRCLAQSLAVARRIARQGGWAQVVLGVSLGPFAAHCWVQAGSLVVNDRVDRVSSYTPILVV